mgnify:CR=1 FL=1
MPKANGAPCAGDMVVFNPGDDCQPLRLVIATRGIEILVMTLDFPNRWVRRDCVRVINESW